MNLKINDEVRVPRFQGKQSPVSGTVTQVGKFKMRILFPVRKFVWIPVDWCEKLPRRKS